LMLFVLTGVTSNAAFASIAEVIHQKKGGDIGGGGTPGPSQPILRTDLWSLENFELSFSELGYLNDNTDSGAAYETWKSSMTSAYQDEILRKVYNNKIKPQLNFKR